MLRRLRVYFTGFGIGLIMVYLMFGRDDSRDLDIWTPSQRILEEVRNDTVLRTSERMLCFQNCLDLSDDQMMVLWTDAKVKSLKPGGDPYQYLITLSTDDKHLEAQLDRDDNGLRIAYLRDHQNPTTCECDE